MNWADGVGLLGIAFQLGGFVWTGWSLTPAWREHADETRTFKSLRWIKARKERLYLEITGRLPPSQHIVGAATAQFGATFGDGRVSTTDRPASGDTREELDALWRNIELVRDDIDRHDGRVDELAESISDEVADREGLAAEVSENFAELHRRQIDVSVLAIALFAVGLVLTAFPIIW